MSIAAIVVNFRTAEAAIEAVRALRDLETRPPDRRSSSSTTPRVMTPLERLREAFPSAGRRARRRGRRRAQRRLRVRHQCRRPSRAVAARARHATCLRAQPGCDRLRSGIAQRRGTPSWKAIPRSASSRASSMVPTARCQGFRSRRSGASSLPRAWAPCRGCSRATSSRSLPPAVHRGRPSARHEHAPTDRDLRPRESGSTKGSSSTSKRPISARRLKEAGWKVFYVADAPITHIGSLATGMTDESRRMPRYWFESRRRYLVKHHGRRRRRIERRGRRPGSWGMVFYQA